MELVLIGIASATGVVAAVTRAWRRVVRSRHVVALLYDDQPQTFLDEIEKDIEQCHNDVYRACLLVNKSAGLYYVGRFEDAAHLLASMRPERLPRTFQSVYFHNLLTSLLGLRRYDEARELMQRHRRLLVPETRLKALNEAIRGSLALYELHCGDRRAGYAELVELSKHTTTDPGRAFRLFHIGLADYEDGYPERAFGSLQLAASLAPNSFVPRALAQMQPQHPRA